MNIIFNIINYYFLVQKFKKKNKIGYSCETFFVPKLIWILFGLFFILKNIFIFIIFLKKFFASKYLEKKDSAMEDLLLSQFYFCRNMFFKFFIEFLFQELFFETFLYLNSVRTAKILTFYIFKCIKIKF
jgi:hypothetical protein